MKFSVEQYAKALYEAVRETGPTEVDKVIENLIAQLKANNDMGKYDAIVKEYENLELEQQGVKKVQATFAHDLKNGKELIESLNLVAGKKLQVDTDVDENLIGGVVIRYDDVLIDASVKTQLEKLKTSLRG